MEFAIKTQPCSKGVCICGIAAIAGGDVFFTDYCQPVHYPVVGFPKCQHNLIAVKRMTASSHMILFPTGTDVLIETLPVDGFAIQVDVSPSVHDLHRSEGLCGRLGSSQLITNNGVASSVDDFILSWGRP
ncbi:uncharacterized protein LOC134274169 isoform X2 [Saccostrea cucullata]|uniref:uncharacterized protein LOC134274169 isoform X2 n=1 Tax=Saccostrea cuccullata TaxID=36930 RepID=UPI002ED4232D